jgi:hypothetical protein
MVLLAMGAKDRRALKKASRYPDSPDERSHCGASHTLPKSIIGEAEKS